MNISSALLHCWCAVFLMDAAAARVVRADSLYAPAALSSPLRAYGAVERPRPWTPQPALEVTAARKQLIGAFQECTECVQSVSRSFVYVFRAPQRCVCKIMNDSTVKAS